MIVILSSYYSSRLKTQENLPNTTTLKVYRIPSLMLSQDQEFAKATDRTIEMEDGKVLKEKCDFIEKRSKQPF